METKTVDQTYVFLFYGFFAQKFEILFVVQWTEV